MPSQAASFHIVNLGCKVNRVEADSFGAALLARGARSVDEEAADLIVVNTCTVTTEADKKARKAVRHALAVNPVADVLVTGCASAISADVFLAMDPRVRVVGKADLESQLGGVPGAASLRLGDGFRTRVGLKVQDGCDHACTYCIVHVARGPARSVPAEAVVDEARAYLRAGVKELVLTGIDIGAYDDCGTGVAKLAERLLEESEAACAPDDIPARIRISSIEPLNVGESLIDLLAASDGRLCRHLHLPLQSGSSKVLREMARPYTAEWFEELVGTMRDRIPSLSLSTDVIVGFPGETEQDFADTCDLVRRARFSRLHVFPYSPRAGTPAAARTDQVPSDEKRRRAAVLRSIGADLSSADLDHRRGTTELVLVEGPTALTESYHELPAPTGTRPGDLVPYVL